MRRVQILLTRSQFDYLKAISAETGESMASVIRRAIERMRSAPPWPSVAKVPEQKPVTEASDLPEDAC